jgi:hypothetical protein
VIVVGVVLYVAIKDRRTPESDQQVAAGDTADDTRDRSAPAAKSPEV